MTARHFNRGKEELSMATSIIQTHGLHAILSNGTTRMEHIPAAIETRIPVGDCASSEIFDEGAHFSEAQSLY